MTPISAVTAPDPYPYYAELVACRPFHRDDTLGLWVASSACAVTAVLTSPACRVRPPGERVPTALAGSPAGEIFARLVRMSDGGAHAAMKAAVSAVTATIERAAGEEARRWAARLAAELEPASDATRLADFALRLPAYALATLLGVPPEDLARVAAWVGDFARAIAPGGRARQLEQGTLAARLLLETLGALLEDEAAGGTALGRLRQEMARAGHGDATAVAANGIGLLSQAYEATAGLIGNTLVTLGRRPEAYDAYRRDRGALGAIVREVARYDAPVQNTRRYLASDTVVGGQDLKAGDTILVVLAVANRDGAANLQPARFDAFRAAPRSFTFGAGPHACAGERLAISMAEAGVEGLLASGVWPERVVEGVAYRPSADTRVPLFA